METQTYNGHCMKCKAKQDFKSDEIKTLKNGAKMAKGPCSVCGTTICRILPKVKA